MKTIKNNFARIMGTLLMVMVFFQLLLINVTYAAETATIEEVTYYYEVDTNSGTASINKIEATSLPLEFRYPATLGEYPVNEIYDTLISSGNTYSEVINIVVPDSCSYFALPNATLFPNLQNVKIPAGCNIGGSGIYGKNSSDVIFNKLIGITVDGTTSDGMYDIDGVLFNSSNDLIKFPSGKTGHYNIPEGTRVIDKYAFAGTHLESLTIPASVSKINSDAFSYSSDLKTVEAENIDFSVNGTHPFQSTSLELFSVNQKSSEVSNINYKEEQLKQLANNDFEIRYLSEKDETEKTYSIEYYYNGEKDEEIQFPDVQPEIVKTVKENDNTDNDNNDTNKVNYSVEYYYDNVLDENMTKHLQNDVGYRVAGVPSGAREHYEFKSISINVSQKPPFNLTADMNNTLVFKVYYESIKVPVIIEYEVDGVIDPTLTEKIEVNVTETVKEVPDKSGDNKEKSLDGTDLPYTPTGENDVITVKYRTVVNYTVNYYYDDELKETESIKGYHNDVIETVDDRNGDYKSDKIETLPHTLDKNGENIINVYYKSSDISYTVTVKYEINGTINEALTYTIDDQKIGTVITKVEDKTGNKFNNVNNNLPYTVKDSDNNVIIVKYETKASVEPVVEYGTYEVHYFYDGKLNENKIDKIQNTVGTFITTYKDKSEGYILDHVIGLPMTLVKGNNNIVEVYYKTKEIAPPSNLIMPNTTFITYTVEYYYNGELNTSKCETSKVAVGTIINTYKDKIVSGYELDKVETLPLTVSKDGNNVIHVYYKTKVDETPVETAPTESTSTLNENFYPEEELEPTNIPIDFTEHLDSIKPYETTELTSTPEPSYRTPQTGTDENVMTYIMLFSGSIVVIGMIVSIMIKKKNEEEE